jgi:ribosomal protein L3 glutamine methyltransferase
MPDEYHAEPELGLVSGDDGLEFTRQLLSTAADYLSQKGVLIVEVGNSWQALQDAFPTVPFLWIEFEQGGHGVFVLTRKQLAASF